MSKLYKSMSCPICNCSTIKRDGEIYTCVACDEKWEMLTGDEEVAETCHFCGMIQGTNPAGSCPNFCVRY